MISIIKREFVPEPDFFYISTREHIILKMKNFKLCAMSLCMGLLCMLPIVAQDSIIPKAIKKNIKVQKYTILEQFEEELVVPVEERIQLKEDRIVKYIRTKELLDTVDISKSKRRKLMRDLRRSPIYSERLNRVIADTKFEDDIDIDE